MKNKKVATIQKSQGRFHHGNLKEAAIEMGLQLVKEGGVDNLSLREVARRLKVSKTAPYRHFQTKEDLLVAVSTRGFKIFAEQLSEVMNQESLSPFERLRQSAQAYLDFALVNPEYYRLLMSNAIPEVKDYPMLVAQVVGPFQTIVDLLSRFRDAGVIRHQDTFHGAMYIISHVHGFCSLVIENRFQFLGMSDDALRQKLDQSLELIWKSLL